MVELLSPYFLNPLAAAVGVGLLSVPILIHLINRMRYRTVEFAAMEFLLQSQQQNRRRVFLQQLLLLLLRILLVALLTLLIGRLILDPSQLAVFRGATLHQIVLLDDSLSTQDRGGRQPAFDRGREYIAGLIGNGDTAGRTKLSVYRTSNADEPVVGLSERTVDRRLAEELEGVLGDLKPSFQTADWPALLDRIAERIEAEPETIAAVHIVTDARAADWADGESVRPAMQRIEAADGRLTLVRTAEAEHANLSVASLQQDAATAAAGVPLRLKVGVRNGGPEASRPTVATLTLDGRELPVTVEFAAIEPGQTAIRSAEVLIDEQGLHEVAVTLPPDAIEGDNTRAVAIDVPAENPVLIVDSDPAGSGGQYLSDALAADRSVTGLAPLIVTPPELRRIALQAYRVVYLVNVGRLDGDAADALEAYVRGGGGLVWFVGDQSRQLDASLGPSGRGLLPGEIQPSVALPDAAEADIVAGDHSLFRVLAGTDNPFLDVVDVRRYSPIALPAATEGDRPLQADVIARLRNNEPLVVEHRLGQGRIVTVLTAASPQADGSGETWNNWASGPGAPSFPVFLLELQPYVAKANRLQSQRTGTPIELRFDAAEYRETVEVVDPTGLSSSVQAQLVEDNGGLERVATYRRTDRPGIYRVELQPQSAAPGDTELRLVAMAIDPVEGELSLVDEGRLDEELGSLATLTIRDPDDIASLAGDDDRGGLLRWLVAAILITLLAEQTLAYRMGYHTGKAGVG